MPEPRCWLLQVSHPNWIKTDARSGSRFACVPANLYCYSGVFGGLQDLGLNMYDVRKKCDKAEDKDGPVSQPLSTMQCRELIG
jgi:hypothetical protein